jgi:UDP-N-acetylglucosamine acyltransferase
MAVHIAATAHVDPHAELADDVEVGPYCVVGPDVRIGRGTRLATHVHLLGATTLGAFNSVGPFVAIGGDPQDLSPVSSTTRVEIGDHNILRERVTIHRATDKEVGVTRIGNHNILMANSHVAHDCVLGDSISMGTSSMLGGHVHVESFVTLLDASVVVHFVTLGRHCCVGVKSKVCQDVPRYLMVNGNPAEIRCIHAAGLKRHEVPPVTIDALHEAHRLIYRGKVTLLRASEILASHDQLLPEVLLLLDFIAAQRAGKGGKSRTH